MSMPSCVLSSSAAVPFAPAVDPGRVAPPAPGSCLAIEKPHFLMVTVCMMCGGVMSVENVIGTPGPGGRRLNHSVHKTDPCRSAFLRLMGR